MYSNLIIIICIVNKNFYVISKDIIMCNIILLSLQLVAKNIEIHLDKHDENNSKVKHQGMVLAQTKDGAQKFCMYSNSCESYVGKSSKDVLHRFINGKTRILVVVGRLQEVFDHNKVSVVGIIRKVRSRVLFTQFVGRAVRKSEIDDCVKAQIVTHRYFEQQNNYSMFNKHAIEDPEDEDDEPEDADLESLLALDNPNINPVENSGINPNANLMDNSSINLLDNSTVNGVDSSSINPIDNPNSNPMDNAGDSSTHNPVSNSLMNTED